MSRCEFYWVLVTFHFQFYANKTKNNFTDTEVEDKFKMFVAELNFVFKVNQLDITVNRFAILVICVNNSMCLLYL